MLSTGRNRTRYAGRGWSGGAVGIVGRAGSDEFVLEAAGTGEAASIGGVIPSTNHILPSGKALRAMRDGLDGRIPDAASGGLWFES